MGLIRSQYILTVAETQGNRLDQLLVDTEADVELADRETGSGDGGRVDADGQDREKSLSSIGGDGVVAQTGGLVGGREVRVLDGGAGWIGDSEAE